MESFPNHTHPNPSESLRFHQIFPKLSETFQYYSTTCFSSILIISDPFRLLPNLIFYFFFKSTPILSKPIPFNSSHQYEIRDTSHDLLRPLLALAILHQILFPPKTLGLGFSRVRCQSTRLPLLHYENDFSNLSDPYFPKYT